jgi:flagellar hook-associated protein 3 FlgL
MQISTKLFNDQQVRQFGKLNENIQNLQERVSSGQNILRASDDPVAAVKLSVAKEQRQLLERFERNVQTAQDRLDLGDRTMQETINVLTRITELTTQAGNGSYDAFNREAMLIEIDELSDVILGLANTRDANGQSLFSGFNTAEDAFVRQSDGTISYNGDRGTHTVQISENMTVATSVDGGTAFLRVDTPQGPKGVFDILNEVKNAIKSTTALSPSGSAAARAKVSFELPRKSQEWVFNISGALGGADIKTTLVEGGLQQVVDDINLKSSSTGVVAELDATGSSITLVDRASGEITMSNIQIAGQNEAVSNITSYANFTPIDVTGKQTGMVRKLTDIDQLLGTSLSNLRSASDHLSLQQTFMAAQHTSKAQVQMDAIQSRKLVINRNISRMGDADLAKLVTDLQAQLTNRDAAQQAFAKIGQQSLFDFIR